MIRTLRPLAAIALLATVGAAAAQTYPAKPVTVVVPFTAGGPTDTVARSLGQAMTKSLGESVVVAVYPVEQITPAALASHLKSEIEKWGPVIKKAGIYAD